MTVSRYKVSAFVLFDSESNYCLMTDLSTEFNTWVYVSGSLCFLYEFTDSFPCMSVEHMMHLFPFQLV